jgi:predicted nucleic acid-binding protein
MKLKSVEIKTQIQQTSSRISELQPQFDEQLQNFEKTQQAFVSNKINLTEHHHEYSKLMLLETTIKSLLATAQRLENELQSAVEFEARQATISEMKNTIAEAKTSFDSFLNSRIELDKAVSRALAGLQNFRNIQETFTKQFRQLAPNVEDPNRINKHSRAEHESALTELEQSGISKETLDFISRRSLADLPPLKYSRVLDTAQQIFDFKKHFDAESQRDKVRDKRLNELAAEREAEIVRLETERLERSAEREAEKVKLEVERLEKNAAKAAAESASPATKKVAVFQSM